MTNEETVIKKLANYLDIEFSEFDSKRIFGYLEEYKNLIIAEIPQMPKEIKMVPVTKFVFKYIERGSMVDKDDIKIIEPCQIIELATRFTGITETQMKGKDRYNDIVLARHISMYFINKVCQETLLSTAKIFNRDHTSVIHAVRHVRDMADVGNQKYTNLIDQISMELSIPKEKIA